MAKSKLLTAPELEALVLKAKQGDHLAFGKLFDYFTHSLFRFVFSRVRSRDDAEDIVSETWKSFWLKLKSYQSKNIKGYLFQIAYSKIIDFFRSQKPTTNLQESVTASDSTNPETRTIKNRRKQTVRDAVRQLPPPYCDVIWLRFIEGLSIKEAALALKRTSISIRVLQHRALKKLQSLIHE